MTLSQPKYEPFSSGIEDMPSFSGNLPQASCALHQGQLPDWSNKLFLELNPNSALELINLLVPRKFYLPATTDRVYWCPNLPKWHQTHAEDDPKYLQSIGRFLKLDYDVIDKSKHVTECSIIFNEGDADCSDGFWGAVWDRQSGERLVNVISCGPQETRIEQTRVIQFENHNLLIPRDFWCSEFSHRSEFLRLASLATFLCLHPDDAGERINWDDVPPREEQ